MISEVGELAFAVPTVLSMRPASVPRILFAPAGGTADARWRGSDIARLMTNDPHDPGPDEGTAEPRRSRWHERDLTLQEARSKLRRSILLGLPLGIASWLLILWALGIL